MPPVAPKRPARSRPVAACRGGATVPRMADTHAMDAGTREANVARRRRMAIIVLAAVAGLFVVQLVALAVGLPELSFAIFGLIIAGWFVLRSYQKRYPI